MMKRIQRLLIQREWQLSLWMQLFGAGGVMTSFGVTAWAASATDWINSYGPIAWVAAGFVGALIFCVVLLLSSMVAERLSRSRLNTKRAMDSTRINPLDDHFNKEVIEVGDIFSYFHQNLDNKHFRECRFVGPMVMAFGNGDNVINPKMTGCNYLVIDEGFVAGVIQFTNTTFRDCEFDNITFILPKFIARTIRDDAQKNGREIVFLGAPLD